MKGRIGSVTAARPLLVLSGIALRLTKSQVGNGNRVLRQSLHSDVAPTTTRNKKVQIALTVLYVGGGTKAILLTAPRTSRVGKVPVRIVLKYRIGIFVC